MTEIIPDVIIHTGNLLKHNHSKRYFSKNALSTSGHKNKELETALENTDFKLTEPLTSGNCNWNHLELASSQNSDLNCSNYDDFLSVHSEENEISISTKIFISSESNPDVVKQAVNQLESKLELKNNSTNNSFKINILILSFPSGFETTSMAAFYKAAKELVISKKVSHVGVADLCLSQLKELETIVEETPDVIQIDYTGHRYDCNSALVKYAVEKDILTLIHTDCTPFITSSRINEITGSDAVKAVDAVIRYAVTAKTRSVLLAKGYFLFLEKTKGHWFVESGFWKVDCRKWIR